MIKGVGVVVIFIDQKIIAADWRMPCSAAAELLRNSETTVYYKIHPHRRRCSPLIV